MGREAGIEERTDGGGLERRNGGNGGERCREEEGWRQRKEEKGWRMSGRNFELLLFYCPNIIVYSTSYLATLPYATQHYSYVHYTIDL